MEVRPPETRIVIASRGSSNSIPQPYDVQIQPNYADYPAVIGNRYQERDMSCNVCNYFGYDISGVMVVGIRSQGGLLVERIRRQRLLREYQIDCVLGYATDNHMHDGKVIEKSTYTHLTRSKVEYVLNKIQTTQQSAIYAGLDLKSQAAYDMAVKGTLKPASGNRSPVLYALQCVSFKPPHFTVRVVTLNENSLFLKTLINGIGLELRTNACAVNIRCTKYGPFTVDADALLPKYWNLEHILQSMYRIRQLVEETANPHRQTH